jgi:hypothetical protein
LITAIAAAKPAKVLAIGLTWRDLVSSVTAAAMVLAYVSFMYRTSPPLPPWNGNRVGQAGLAKHC